MAEMVFGSGKEAGTQGSPPPAWASFCREVQGSPARGCWCGLTHGCHIPSTTSKGLQGVTWAGFVPAAISRRGN